MRYGEALRKNLPQKVFFGCASASGGKHDRANLPFHSKIPRRRIRVVSHTRRTKIEYALSFCRRSGFCNEAQLPGETFKKTEEHALTALGAPAPKQKSENRLRMRNTSRRKNEMRFGPATRTASIVDFLSCTSAARRRDDACGPTALRECRICQS